MSTLTAPPIDLDLASLPVEIPHEFDALGLDAYLDTVEDYGFNPELAEQIRRHEASLAAYFRMECEAERGPSCENWGPPHPTERWRD